ncbi:hypothetical protein [Acidovorax sp. CCYZU-2555]|uniref:hypothetical protein n=1 Tax=Acidovorax sp. CCYZU-2555 TaxID=2835042 RepID=UPI001BCF311B|nr:hypothetical protein [Acidovorax sp. CCYZU-2555]MBS7776393.1 hypothetical protein [Acidovorax sp. CCYZU-2555]
MQKHNDPEAPVDLTLREAGELDAVDDSKLSDYLSDLAPEIGWIVIYFNSLEDGISCFIREAILRDAIQDERMDVFLAGMMFSGKARALLDLYGQMILSGGFAIAPEDLRKVEVMLTECAARRNEYAHADWIGMKLGGYVRVKSQSKRNGISHRYKRYDLGRIQADVNFIRDARDTLFEFNERMWDLIRAHGQVPFEQR